MCLSVGPTSEIESDVASDLHTQKLYLGVFVFICRARFYVTTFTALRVGWWVLFLKLGLVLCVFVSTGGRE